MRSSKSALGRGQIAPLENFDGKARSGEDPTCDGDYVVAVGLIASDDAGGETANRPVRGSH